MRHRKRKWNRLILEVVLLIVLLSACGRSVVGSGETGVAETEAAGRSTAVPETEPETTAPAEPEPESTELQQPETIDDETVGNELPEQYFIYDLNDMENQFYRINPSYDRENQRNIIREDGVYYIESDSGRYYGREVILTVEQKALLDAGFTMVIMYGDQEIDRVTSEITSDYMNDNIPCVGYVCQTKRGYARAEQILPAQWEEKAKQLAGVDLSAPPYNGVGYLMRHFEVVPASHWIFACDNGPVRIPLEPDMIIEIGNERWTVEDFYENNVQLNGFSMNFNLYMEDGEIVRIEVWASP